MMLFLDNETSLTSSGDARHLFRFAEGLWNLHELDNLQGRLEISHMYHGVYFV